jgi:ketosteroid isomerase-like protein
MLANEFQANYASVAGNKKQLLAAIKSATTRFESMTNSEMKALVFGDTAIVLGLSTSKSSMAGKDTSGRERFTDVFVKREGRWQCVIGYSTKVQ